AEVQSLRNLTRGPWLPAVLVPKGSRHPKSLLKRAARVGPFLGRGHRHIHTTRAPRELSPRASRKSRRPTAATAAVYPEPPNGRPPTGVDDPLGLPDRASIFRRFPRCYRAGESCHHFRDWAIHLQAKGRWPMVASSAVSRGLGARWLAAGWAAGV